MTRVAAIDCGTNTIKLLVADLDASTGEQVELVRETRMVRLGQDVDRTGRLADDALTRAFAAVEEYARLIKQNKASVIRFCATSAARDASNADVFAKGVKRRLGVLPEVLSGAEEAQLSFDGATRLLGEVPGPVLVVDIGGGSTELVLGSGHGQVHAGHSLDVGSVRMTERHLHGDPPRPEEIAAATADIDQALDTLPELGIDLQVPRTVVAVSGTGLTVAAAVLDLRRLVREDLDRAAVSVPRVHSIVDGLLSMSVGARRALPYMQPGRADVIGAGALVLDRVLRRTSVSELHISVSDILDGIAWSRA